MAKDGMLKPGSKDSSQRCYVGGGPRPDNNQHKRAEATERNDAWRKLTPKQQLASLDGRLGKNVGAKKQRQRIKASMNSH